MPSSKRKPLAEKLISIVSKEVSKVPDFRKRAGKDGISLHDAILTGFAMMHLKYPSLLQFDRDCLKKPAKLDNLQSQGKIMKLPLLKGLLIGSGCS